LYCYFTDIKKAPASKRLKNILKEIIGETLTALYWTKEPSQEVMPVAETNQTNATITNETKK